MANSYDKIDKSNQRDLWEKLLTNFIPHSDYDVKEYYGVSLIKKKKGGMYSIKLIHDYDSNGKFSSAFEMESMKRTLSMIAILEWFAKDDHLRAASDDGTLDLSMQDGHF